ncbi:hypothetical protein COO60DRAFT_168180 [Scenedesmus sp. NREL 46B-D3]|nr:hypothetical protein COO60DRAFT_168180 [Scenedesmus sp. NREL 46B-D3]
MLAAAAIQEGQVLLQVPESLFMTANTAVRSKLCGKLVKAAELPEWQALVLHLLCERAAGPDSSWAPYIAVLGRQRHHPLLWSSELQGQLAGSPMMRLLTDRLQQVQQDTEQLVAAGANELEVAQRWQQQTQTPLVDVGSVSWAAAVLLGRSFQLDMSEPELPLGPDMSYYGSWQAHGPAVLALVPWADMLRHSSEAGEAAMLAYDPEARAALLAAHRPYAPGAEVFDSHGPSLSWADLVMDHGCVGEGSSDNPRYDALLFQHLQPRGSRNAALLEALTALTGGPPALVLTPSGPDVTCMAALRAGLASDAELIKAGWRSGSKGSDVELCARVMGRLSVPVSLATERRVLQLLDKAVQTCSAAYPSSIECDRQELQQQLVQQQQQQQAVGDAGSTGDNAADSIAAEHMQVRIGVLRALISEKSALLDCAEAVAAWQAALEALAAGAGSSIQAQVSAKQLAAVYGSDGDDDSWTCHEPRNTTRAPCCGV